MTPLCDESLLSIQRLMNVAKLDGWGFDFRIDGDGVNLTISAEVFTESLTHRLDMNKSFSEQMAALVQIATLTEMGFTVKQEEPDDD